MPTFKIEQLALKLDPTRLDKALRFLAECGIKDWVFDEVRATGEARGFPVENIAHLRFNYEAFSGKELEVLRYVEGDNWLSGSQSTVSHIGMHVTESELREWRGFMKRWDIDVEQEVHTVSHTNRAIKDIRRYQYVVFGTRSLIGTDMKFIVRIDI